MASNKNVHFGPVALGNIVANILNPGTTTGGVGMPSNSGNTYFILRHIRIVNKTASSATVTLYLGATGGSSAGTEFAFNGTTVAANSYVDWYGALRMDTTDFLTGEASAATTLTFQAEGEIGIN